MYQQITISGAILIPALLGIAVVSDMRHNRIPNWLVCGVLALGLLVQIVNGGFAGAAAGLLGAAIGLLAFLPFYSRRAMGAGDVKLMAAVGAWLGPIGAALACALTLVAGLCLGVTALLAKSAMARGLLLDFPNFRMPGRMLGAFVIERDGQTKVPYALAIAAGSVLSAWQMGHLHSLLRMFS